MTTLAPPLTPHREAGDSSDKEQFLALGAVEWETYQEIAKALTGRHVRLTYDRGRLDFMTISGRHGTLSRLFGRLIAALTEELDIPIRSCGDMTCDRESTSRGLEPDECFYLEALPQNLWVCNWGLCPSPFKVLKQGILTMPRCAALGMSRGACRSLLSCV